MINKIVDGLSFETHKFLVEGAAEVDWPVPRHGDMLQVACWGDRLAWAEFGFRHGADVNAFSPLSGEILLATTARRSSVEMVDLLLQHGAGLHDSGAVVAAAGDGRLDTLSVLLGRGANIREFPPPDRIWNFERDLESPLHAAVAARESGVVEYLIKEGAKTNLRDSKGRTPLARARENRDAKMVKLLLSYRSHSGRKTCRWKGTRGNTAPGIPYASELF